MKNDIKDIDIREIENHTYRRIIDEQTPLYVKWIKGNFESVYLEKKKIRGKRNFMVLVVLIYI